MSERDELIAKLRAMRAKCDDGPIMAIEAHVWVNSNGYNDSEEFGTYGFNNDDKIEKANNQFLMLLFNSFETLVDK